MSSKIAPKAGTLWQRTQKKNPSCKLNKGWVENLVNEGNTESFHHTFDGKISPFVLFREVPPRETKSEKKRNEKENSFWNYFMAATNLRERMGGKCQSQILLKKEKHVSFLQPEAEMKENTKVDHTAIVN